MQTELESKWLSIDLQVMRTRLQSASAKLVTKERLMIRAVFDYPDSEEAIQTTAKLLELDPSKALHGSVEVAYQAVYNVSEDDIDSWPEISFSPVPDWLENKRK